MKHAPIPICLVILLCACAPLVSVAPYTTQTFEPTTHVEVLQEAPSDRRYTRIAELRVEVGHYPEEALSHILDRAKEIGADAIILHGITSRGILEVPLTGSFTRQTSTARIPLKTLYATAIKYKS